MELSEQEREQIHRIAEATNRKNRRARERARREIGARKEAAWIDMAVDSDRYLDLLGPALDSPFKVDLVDLPQARSHIREAILRDGVEVFHAE